LGALRRALVLTAALGAWAPLRAYAAAPEPRAAIEGVSDKDLRERIETAIGTSSHAPDNGFEARRRAEDAAEQAAEVLRSEGYYDYDVDPDISDTDPPHAVVRIDPGQRFHIGRTAVDWLRPADERAETAAIKALALDPGSPGRAADVIAAEGRAVAALHGHGYPDAKPEPRRVVVDHADHSVNPTFSFDPAALVRLDGVQVLTAGRTNPAWVEKLAPWNPGQIYSPEAVAELERRLRDTRVYRSVTVALAPADQITAEGERPVVVSLADRSRATIEAGASYATTEGPGVEAVYSRFNLLHRADTLSVGLRFANIERKFGVQLSLPHWRRPDDTLSFGPSVYQDITPAYHRVGADFTADLKHRIGKYSFYHYGLAVAANHNDELAFVPGTQIVKPLDVRVVVANLAAGIHLDRSDDPLDPHHGWRLIADTQPTAVTGDEHIVYLQALGQVSGYLSLGRDDRTVLAARLKLGSLINGAIPQVPSDQRFYSGGGGSVRGYAYQGIGPQFPNGIPEGGLSLVETSVEMRRRLFGRWGAAAFVDAGSVGLSQTPDFSELRVGVGVGARYLITFAPIRMDVAYPLNPTFHSRGPQLYISIGQAF
jgi:translocation and assembly module TamA